MDEWNFRWLVVGPAGQDDIGLVLMPVPTPPMLDTATSEQLAEIVAKGAGGTLFLETDDCQAAYDELSTAASSSTTRPPRSRTASTRRSVTRPATTSASPRSSSSRSTATDRAAPRSA